MNLKSYIFILTTLLLSETPVFLCQIQQYRTCTQPFQCGNMIRDISYPFFGGSRPLSCGYPGFQLTCNSDTLLINITSLTYHVLEIEYSTQTLRVAREDLSPCPTYLLNTTLDSGIFNYSSDANDRNITLFYGCPPLQLPNQYSCRGSGTDNYGIYVREDLLTPGVGTRCAGSISVRVNETAGQLLGFSATPIPRDDLLNALTSGFSIEWSANNSNCDNCVGSGGVCGYEQSTSSFACHCEDRTYNLTCGDRNGNGGNGGTGGGLSEMQKIVTLVIILGITCIIIPCIILICHFSNKCISCDPDEQSNQYVEKFLREQGSLAPKRYRYKELKKITKSFTDKLGKGGFGSVYKGVLPDGRPVAVKVLKETEGNGEEFINEVSSISRTSHVNIVNLLGFCYNKNKRALVYEFMPNKSLDRFINLDESVGKGDQLGWKKLYEIAIGVARGLEYLHRGCNARIIHFDIKPQNILLDEEFCPKISDFGLAKLCRKKQSILTSVFGTRGTFGYIAPEVFCRNFGPVSHKSDVYSYGMMILEMAGARKIEEASSLDKSSERYFPDKIYEQEIVCGIEIFNENLSQEEVQTMRKMFLIAFWCIQTVPSYRPSMSKVVEMLEGSVESIQIPPKPLLSHPMLSQTQSFSFSSSFTVLDLETESINEV